MSGGDFSRIEPLRVVGGVYGERCRFPNSYNVFGSGLRAASALGGRAVPVELYTYLSRKWEADMRAAAATCRFRSSAILIDNDIEFEYRHSLADPVWSSQADVPAKPLIVAGENVLAFGMLEGNPIVHGTRVVYDPQCPGSPQHFAANGSRSEHLAIVCNQGEARLLTGEENPEVAGRALVTEHGAEVAVIKAGALGAWVVTTSACERVPAYRANVSTLIGSGDIFSAVFAYHWAALGEAPAVAALNASKSAAYYCATEILPLPEVLPPKFPVEAMVARPEAATVYLAGPFFTPAELHAIEEARAHLERQGLRVFSPFHAVGYGPDEVVAQADLEGLRQCDFVFALVDGLDAGTLFEIGYARALGKPVIAVATAVSPRHLTMLRGSDCLIYENYVPAIYHAAWQK